MTRSGADDKIGKFEVEAVSLARTVGRQIIYLTGNAPATRTRKMLRAIGIGNRPRLTAYDSVFASELRGIGTLTATIIDVTDKGNLNLQGPMVRIQTCFHRTESMALDDRPKFYICPSLFDLMPEESWLKHKPAAIAKKLAQIGELLISGNVSLKGSKLNRLVGPPEILISRDDRFDRLFKVLLQSVLIASGYDEDNRFLAYKPRTPTQPAAVLPIGFSGTISPAISAIINLADNAQVLISRHEDAIVVTPNEMFLSVKAMNIVDKMKAIRHSTELLEQSGFCAGDLPVLELQLKR
jgi:hypothetical protein